MGSRAFNAAVVVLWLSTMTWLVVAKVLPPLWVGDPPNYRTIVSADAEHPRPPVCWAIRWNDRLLGWAMSDMVHVKDGMTEIHSRVYFCDLPLNEMLPPWISTLVSPMLPRSNDLDLDARSRMDIDPLGRLSSFESRLRLSSLPDAIRLSGRVDGSNLTLVARSPGFEYTTERYLPPDALVGDELSPQANLPGLSVGQSWTMPVYSPLRPSREPMEILQATVERTEPIVWNGETVSTHVVVYRADPGSGLMGLGEARGKLWVRADGMVLKQEASALNSRLHFVRLPDEVSQRLSDAVGDAWRAEISSRRGAKILSLIDDEKPAP